MWGLLALGSLPAANLRAFGENLARAACAGRARRSRPSGGPMKKLLNTLYVTTEGASLRKDGENLLAEVDGAERARVPLHMLASVVSSARFLCRRP